MEHFRYEIEKQNLDIIGFKSFGKNKIQTELINLKNLYKKLRGLIQVPYWNPYTDSDSTDGYEFDKQVFYEDLDRNWTQVDYDNATREYAKHLENAEEIASQMEQSFLKIQRLANKEPFEFILPWKWFS